MEVPDYAKDLVNRDLDRALLKDYVKALKDEDFKKTVTKLGLTEDVAMKYTSKLERTACELANCSKCKGLGNCKNLLNGFVYYPTKEGNRLRFDNIACKYTKANEEAMKNRAISFEEPELIRNAKMADIDLTDKNRLAVIKWIKNFYTNYSKNEHIKGLYLHGSFGSGKSYIVSALLNEIASKGKKVVIMYYPEMLRVLKESFGYDDEYASKMKLLQTCDILLIDDIGAETVTSWSRDEVLGTILQHRMDSMLPTFFTSNLNIEELETHLSYTKNSVDIVKAKRIIERIKQLTEDLELVSENRRK